MKNYGKIPPHFLYILESEGIQISEMRSSNFALKNSFDRMIVKVPYCNRTLDIQVIFDAINNSNPPDFLFIKEENLLINYPDIIKEWNFKDSSTLHNCLLKLKNLYALAQEKRLREEIEKNAFKGINDDIIMRDEKNNSNNFNNYGDPDDFSNAIPQLWRTIDKVFYAIKNKISKYRNIDVNNLFSNCKTGSFGSNSNLNNSAFNNSFNASGKKLLNINQSINYNNVNNNNMTPNNLNKNFFESLNKKGSNSNNNNLNFLSNKDQEEFNINEIPPSIEVKNVSTNNHKNRETKQSNSTKNNNININLNPNTLNTPNPINTLNSSDNNNNAFNNINTFNSNFNNTNNNNYPLLEILPEISFSYARKESAAFLLEYTEYKNTISIAYPLDIELRSRNMPRFPYILVTFYLNYDMKFRLDLLAPSFMNTSNFKNIWAKNPSSLASEIFDLKNFENIIESYESTVLEYFRDMAYRETIINKIINLNLGFTLEIDAAGFRKFSQYIHCNDKNNFKNRKFFDANENINFLKKGSQGSTSFTASPNPKAFPFSLNYIVCYNFDKEDARVLQVNLIDSDQLSNITNKKFSFNNKDLDNLINNVFEFLISNVNSRLNQAQ